MSSRAFDMLSQVTTKLMALRAIVQVQGAAQSGMNERLRDLEALCEEVLDPAVQELIKAREHNDDKVTQLVRRIEALKRNPSKMVREPVEGVEEEKEDD